MYGKPLLPNMQHTNTIPAQQQDHLRFQAVQMVAKRLERAEPPLRREVVECILDPDSHMFSLRRSKANFYRVTSLFSSTVAVAKWFDGIRKWNNPLTTILVHVLFLVLVRYGDAQLILPMVFLCMVIIGAWNYPRRPREPPHIDTVLSHAELAHPDELDEEFDTLPPPYMDTELWYPDQAHPNDEFNFNTSKPDAILRMRYDRLRSVGGRLQAVGFDLATQGERAQSLLSWNDPRVTPIFMTLSLVVTVVLYLTPSRVVTAAAVLYLLRHPWFRSEQPSMLRTFFRRLHAKDDVLL